MDIWREFRKTEALLWQRYSPHRKDVSALSVRELTVRYENAVALDGVSFEVSAGERLAVVGPNGAGKSTLFKCVAGVTVFSEGDIHVYGYEPGGHICIAYLPQRTQVDWRFPVSVADVVMMGRVGRQGLFRPTDHKDREMVHNALEVVDLLAVADRPISQLSGGQQQRMFIARAVAQEADLVLMDEPLSGLDVKSQEDIFKILNTLRSQKVTVLVALHDLQIAAEKFDRVLLLNRRLIAIGSPEDALAAKYLMEAYEGRLRIVNAEKGYLALGDTCCDDEAHVHD